MPGPGPKPTVLKVIAGNPGKRALPKNEPKPPIDVDARCPTRLKGDARKEWKRIAPVLRDAGLLTKIDGTALTLYCEAHELYLKAKKHVDTEPLIDFVGEHAYPTPTPYLAIMNKQADRMRQFLIEFGMTPSSRTRVQVTPPKGAEEDEWGDLDR